MSFASESDLSSGAQRLEEKEKPSNGIAGLSHWRHDLLAGFVVSLVSLPLSSGIAIASGAPPIYGIISSVIAGLIFPFVGGSFVTISGPAAGLAPALMATMIALGGAGDADHVGAGYPFLLAVIFMVGVCQVIMARLGLARFAAIFPASVVEGMLGAIGVLIFVKALPLFLGFTGENHAHGFMEYVAAIPHWWSERSDPAFAVGAGTLLVMALAASPWAKRWKLFAKVPPHLFGALFAIPAAMALSLAELNPGFLISVPDNPLSGITLPDFAGLMSRTDLWWGAVVGLVTLTLIDGVESLATSQAIDRIDPFERQSKPGRVLMAMGISNVVSSLVGGLTVIPGGVKSKTCIEAGGRTLWANFANALFLIVFLFVAPGIVALLPKAALGAILLYTGWKMVHPSIIRALGQIGKEQVLVYCATIAAVLLTDLLVGVLMGTALKMVLMGVLARKVRKTRSTPAGMWTIFKALWRAPVGRVIEEDGVVRICVEGSLVSFNTFWLQERIAQVEKEGQTPRVELGPGVDVIDHTSMEVLHRLQHSAHPVVVKGLERFVPRGRHSTSLRVAHTLG